VSILIYTAGLEETLMKNFTVALFAGLISLAGISAQAATPEQECQKLKNDYNVIYASKGFCFKIYLAALSGKCALSRDRACRQEV